MKIITKLEHKSENPSSDSPLKIAFLGDSVTHGCFELVNKGEKGFDCVYDMKSVYHSLLKTRIETVFSNCAVSVINAGISGDSAPNGAERVQRDIISASPDLCVVCYGLNDVLSPDGAKKYIAGLDAVFEQLSAAQIDTVFMTPNMMCTYKMPELSCDDFLTRMGNDCVRAQTDGTMDSFMSAAVTLCNKRAVPVCDCYARWKSLYSHGADVTCLLANHLNHPVRYMHGLFAKALFELLFF